MLLKIHFAGDDNTNDQPYKKLRVKSNWLPDQPPLKILSRLSAFGIAQLMWLSGRLMLLVAEVGGSNPYKTPRLE
jgi:hypothetical protein